MFFSPLPSFKIFYWILVFYFYLIFLHFTLFSVSFVIILPLLKTLHPAFFLFFLSWINPYNPLKYFVNQLSLTWPCLVKQAHIPTLTSLFKRTRNYCCKTLTLLYLSLKDSRVRIISKLFKYPNNNLNTTAKTYWNSLSSLATVLLETRWFQLSGLLCHFLFNWFI